MYVCMYGYRGKPLHLYVSTPLPLYASTPLFTPLSPYASTSLHLCTSTPLHLCASRVRKRLRKFFSISFNSRHHQNSASHPFSSFLPYSSCPLFSWAPFPLVLPRSCPCSFFLSKQIQLYLAQVQLQSTYR